MKIKKCVGVVGLILVTLFLPVYVLAGIGWSSHYPMDYKVKVESNQTVCSYLKQFVLNDNVILSVLHRDGEVSVDICLFLKQTATIRGIPLNLRQWNTLERVSNSLNGAIEEAKDL